ncbi:MAG TPA: hypothetical protein VGH90_04815 [Chthoniobacteraceae bacterium]
MNRLREHICWCAAAVLAGGLGFSVARIAPSSGPEERHPPVATASGSRPNEDFDPKPDQTKKASGLENLRGALKSRSSLNRAQRLFAALSSMSADNFRSFASKPERVADLECFPAGDLQTAVWDAFVERWLEVDSAGAFPALIRADDELNQHQLVGSLELMDSLAHVKPEAVLASLSGGASAKLLSSSYGILNVIPAAFEHLAERDPSSARKYLDACPPAQRDAAESAIADGIARHDPAAGASLAVDLKNPDVLRVALESAENIGPGVMNEVLEAAAGKIPFDSRFAPLVLAHPELPWRSDGAAESASQTGTALGAELLHEAVVLTPEQRKKVLMNADNFPRALRGDLILATLNAWAAEEPQKAMEWALANPSSASASDTRNLPVVWTANAWLRSDPAAARAWLSQQSPAEWRDDCLNNAAAFLALSGKVQEAIALFRPTAGANAAVNITYLAEAQAKADPAAAALWLQGLPTEADTVPATTQVLESWIQKDPEAAARWVEALPSGVRRDRAMRSYAQAAAEHDPEAAGAWAVSIGDPAQRRAAAEVVFQKMDQSDPAGARAWLQSLPAVDAEWRDRYSRMPR